MSSSAQQPDGGDDRDRKYLNRRGFLKAGAAATGAAVAGLGASHAGYEPVGEAKAIFPWVFVGGAAGTAVALDWAIGEVSSFLSPDDPPGGLTQAALEDRIEQSIFTRKSTNASTFVDNQNIMVGIGDAAYADAKVAAIEAINDGKTESNVQADAEAALDAYETTVVKNVLRSWNESIQELKNICDGIDAHPDLGFQYLQMPQGLSGGGVWYEMDHTGYTLADGTSFSVHAAAHGKSTTDIWYLYTPISESDNGTTYSWTADDHYVYSPETEYLREAEWNSVVDTIEQEFTDVRNGIITWVNSVYGSVQSGEITTAELITPREHADMLSSDEGVPNAVADLIALNMPIDAERVATVTIPSKGISAKGILAVTDDTNAPIEVGVTYSPTDFGSVYLTYDASTSEMEVTTFESAVDGGNFNLTSEPETNHTYLVETAANESAQVDAENFTEVGGNYQADLSDQLENPITTAENVTAFADTAQTTWETTQIQDDFVVESFEDASGETYTQASFDSKQAQDDSNYITQAEWDAMEAKQEELIDEYEASQQSASGGGAGLLDGVGELAIAAVAVVLGAAALLGGGK